MFLLPGVAAAGPCLLDLAKAGAQFTPVPQPGADQACPVEEPVRLSAVTGKHGTVKLADQPILNCRFAAVFAAWVNDTVQPLAIAKGSDAIVVMGTGPGFDCRLRRGETTEKMSEHGKAGAVDIATVALANGLAIPVKDAVDTTAPGYDFLVALRAAACSAFTTVLGPGANPAHAEHFHIDLAQRKGGYRICE